MLTPPQLQQHLSCMQDVPGYLPTTTTAKRLQQFKPLPPCCQHYTGPATPHPPYHILGSCTTLHPCTPAAGCKQLIQPHPAPALSVTPTGISLSRNTPVLNPPHFPQTVQHPGPMTRVLPQHTQALNSIAAGIRILKSPRSKHPALAAAAIAAAVAAPAAAAVIYSLPQDVAIAAAACHHDSEVV